MYDHADEAAEVTGDDRWRDLTADHTRLWTPDQRVRRRRDRTDRGHLATADLKVMLAFLDIMAAPTHETVTVTVDPRPPVTHKGLGDPQAARAWLIQALTGRRASEVLMLDFNPLDSIPGVSADPGDDTAFVARLRYQQTKVDGVVPTILVEQAVVNVIEEQQQWVRHKHPDADAPRYLFLNPRGNFKALRARTYKSYEDALDRLDEIACLVDGQGQPMKFTQTHRLRHTRATELLNAGVPIHVVQRYLGHRSPEMTMHYAATLAEAAEAEFLRYKKVGADGRDIDIAPRDLLDLSHLDRRADRVLPNGLCLLPPTATCDKGNACLPCGSFATDRTHLDDHRQHRDRISALVAARQQQFRDRYGGDMPQDNIWLRGRRRELASLDAIIERLESETDDNDRPNGAFTGPGTAARGAVPVTLVTDDAHATLLHNELRNRGARD